VPPDWDRLPNWDRPGGPHLEVGTYEPRLSDQESIVATLHTLLGLGAVLKGVGTAQVPEERFVRLPDWNVRPISLSELEPILADPTQQILQFYMEGYFESTSVVSLDTISEEAALTDRHPVVVWFEAFKFELGEDDEKARIGDQARRLLLELARSPEVAYGAILGEGWWMESPSEMRGERSQIWLGNFLLTDWVDAEDREHILDAFEGAYVEELEFGTYVSTYEWLNPGRVRLLDGRQRERSDLVRRVLAKNLA
jgi:hypothetical protein